MSAVASSASSSISAGTEGAPPASMVHNALRSDSSWPVCDPNWVLLEMIKLKKEDCKDEKLFWKSYTQYDKLTPVQKNKAQAFFEAQSELIRNQIHDNALNASTVAASEASTRAAVTSKDDRARLLHLMVYPEAQAAWTGTRHPMNREELDDDECTSLSAFEALAVFFNDYESTTFQNETIEYEDGESLVPYKAREGCVAIAPKCFDLDPNNRDRPARNGTWVMKFSKEMRATISKIYTAFKQSGQQDAEDKFGEWLKFSSNYADVYTYAICLLPYGAMDQMGKALPEAQQRDSGAAARNLSPTPGAANKRRQRERKRARAEEQKEGGSSSSNDQDTVSTISVGPSLTNIVAASLKQANQ
jgi:hypothetical protein